MPQHQTLTQSEPFIQTLPASTAIKRCDVLIVGAGLAGITTALSLPPHLKVVVLAKQDLQACSSHYAQGGIAAVIDAKDSVTQHVSDTLIAGDGLCDEQATTQILSQGATSIDWLLKHNVAFTTKPTTTATIKPSTASIDIDAQETSSKKLSIYDRINLADLHLTQEGGHGRRRVAHADDATGRHIMAALHETALNTPNIHMRANHEALSLITESEQDTDISQCQGALVFDSQTKQLIEFQSQAVVLASGGLGQLFSRATAPNVCVGDGIMMAWEAGARLANLEFIQFHPTGLVYDKEQGDRNFLISEAVRGEGGYLLNPVTGKRFMPEYDARAELAPRDIVARAIANEIANNQLGYVYLDISHQPAAFIRQHFPDIYAHCLSLGIDITSAPIPVAPTAHYTCGGVLTSSTGQTDVVGLYAAGEVCNTGLHGANRLASNSLLECVVVGRAIAQHLPNYLKNNTNWQAPEHTSSLDQIGFKVATKLLNDQSAEIGHKNIQANKLSNSATFHPTHIKANDEANQTVTNKTLASLKQLMTQNMGIRRSAVGLKQALAQVLFWRQQLNAQSHVDTTIFDIDNLRLNRLLTLAVLLLQSALTRTESRGGHYRDDYPNQTDKPAISIVYPLSS